MSIALAFFAGAMVGLFTASIMAAAGRSTDWDDGWKAGHLDATERFARRVIWPDDEE